MSQEPSPEIQSELLDDYYSEADEHLSEIRRALLGLEKYAESAQVDLNLVEGLFRSFHTFKGNSALIGLATAEGLAHAAEDYLRQLNRGEVPLSPRALDVLVAATQQLERVVLAHRHKQPIPEVAGMIDELHGLIQNSGSVRADGTSRLPGVSRLDRKDLAGVLEEARASGSAVVTAVFVPTRELDSRGVNVNSIRTRLAALGEIIRGTPHVRPEGSIAFEFLLASRDLPQDLAAWEADGVCFGLQSEAPAPSPAPAQTAEQGAPALEASLFIAPSHIVRVDLGRLDELMRIAGELVIHRARLEEQIGRLDRTGGAFKPAAAGGLQEVSMAMSRSLRDLREAIMRVRLVPVSEVFQRMPFVVRDLARETGKSAKLLLSGQETEIDKYLIERLKDPLLHLVRNAVSHGIESEAERVGLGKPAQATISLAARTVGDCVVIEVGDDGRGIDGGRVAERAAGQGWSVPERLDNAGLLKLICLAGFSTRDEADRAAGRGVGMAVVERTVRELGGTLGLTTERGRGTRFTLSMPLTLAIADAFIVVAGGQTFAVPQTFVREVVEMTSEQVQQISQAELFRYRDLVAPLLRMTSLLGKQPNRSPRVPVLVLSSENGCVGLAVDRVIGQREIVFRAMRDPLVQTSGIAGATELGDGRPVLILDVGAITGGLAMAQRTAMNSVLSAGTRFETLTPASSPT